MTKKVFISYSHDSTTHKNWVKHLATVLIKNGVDVILDQWDLRAGQDIPQFVEDSVINSDRVILVCTENYAKKANDRVGGVGVEALIINSSIMENIGTSKFLVIVRQQGDSVKLPNLLKSRLYIDFSLDSEFEFQMDNLLRELHDTVGLEKPALGQNPFVERSDGDHDRISRFEIEESEFEENGTKLDLARAYIELGDKASAEDILTEIMEEGSVIQQKEARVLLLKVQHNLGID